LAFEVEEIDGWIGQDVERAGGREAGKGCEEMVLGQGRAPGAAESIARPEGLQGCQVR